MEPLTGIAAWIRSLLQNKNQGDIAQDVIQNKDARTGDVFRPGYIPGTSRPETGPEFKTGTYWRPTTPSDYKASGYTGDKSSWKGPVIGGSSLRPDFWGTPAERSYPEWQPDDEVPYEKSNIPSFHTTMDKHSRMRFEETPEWGPNAGREPWPTGLKWIDAPFWTDSENERFQDWKWQGHGEINYKTGFPTWMGDMPTYDPRTGLDPWQEGHPYYDKHHAKPDRLRRQTYYQER